MADIIVSSPFNDIDVDVKSTFADYVLMKLKKFGNDTAIIDSSTGKRYSYDDLLNLTNQFSVTFESLCLNKGDVVSICLPNCVEILPIALCITSLGGIFHTSNPNYTVEELIYQYKLVKSRFVITTESNRDKIIEAKNQCPTIENMFLIDGDANDPKNLHNLSKCSIVTNASEKIHVLPSDIAFLFSSSGTTGLPKQIMLTHLNLVANLSQLCNASSSSQDMKMFCPSRGDVVLSVFPYFHLAGLMNGLIWVLKEGGCSIILPKYETTTFLKTIETFKPNILIAPPPVHVFLTKSDKATAADLSSIRTVVNRAAPIAPSVVQALCERLKMPYVINGYGMTELSTIGLIIPVSKFSETKYGSCGVPLPNTKCKVVDIETGATLGPNKSGQLLIKGLNITKGYLYNQAATDEAIDKDGWLHTGDICYYDEDGYFYIIDRIKEMIKVKAFQVAPAEIEQCLLKHSSIADAAVVGILDDYAGELPFAFVVKKSDVTLTEDEIQKFVADRLTAYKHVTGGVRFVDSIPKNPSGKILRRLLRDQIRNELANSKKIS